jgi:hypothetical protein
MVDKQPPNIVLNARLCSASECTHLILPHEEYKFKRCSLCRLYQKERRFVCLIYLISQALLTLKQRRFFFPSNSLLQGGVAA